jgi:putative ABC transport system permease protein
MTMFARRLRYWFNRSHRFDGLGEEMRLHVEEKIAELRQQGVSEADAERRAHQMFGNGTRYQEEAREVWISGWWDTLVRECNYGIRSLLRKPVATAVMVSSLAIGLAVTMSILSVANAYLLRSMPYPAADRLYHVMYTQPGQPEPRGIALIDWKAMANTVELADSNSEVRFYARFDGAIQEVMGLASSTSTAETLGVRVATGRYFEASDFRPGSEPVALIGQTLWKNQFGADPNVVGRQFRANLNLEGPLDTYRIVGVLSPEFRGLRDHLHSPTDILIPRRGPGRAYMVRLREGVPASLAAERITEAVREVAPALPPNWKGAQLESVHERYVKEIRPLLTALSIASILLLVLVCVNVGILMLLRSLRRQHEVAVRLAIGAGRREIVRMVTAEAFVLSGTAVLCGFVLTKLSLGILAPLIETELGRPAPGGAIAIGLSPATFLAVGGSTLLLTLSLSFFPMLTGQRLAETLRRSTRGGMGTNAMARIRSSLVAFEVAGSLMLLVGCGLMIQSVLNLVHTDLGYETANILRSRLALPARTYPDTRAQASFYERLVLRLSSDSVAAVLTNYPPFYEPIRHPVELASGPMDGTIGVVAVSPGYFDMLHIPTLQGRVFLEDDRIGADPVAIVSESLAVKLWPNQNAIGQRLRTADDTPGQSPLTSWRTVVGVVRDVRQTHKDEDLRDIYIPFFQAPGAYAPLYIQTNQPAAVWLPKLRAMIAEIDSDVLLSGLTSLTEDADKEMKEPRFLATMLGAFAGFAMLLVVLGIYGVTAYAAQQREHEVTVRLALGATRGSIARLFLKDSGATLMVGIVIGLTAAAAGSRLIVNQLHGVQPFDPLTQGVAAAALVGIGLLATWWPTRRVSNSSPVAVLKQD